jgi:hypothetical protein
MAISILIQQLDGRIDVMETNLPGGVDRVPKRLGCLRIGVLHVCQLALRLSGMVGERLLPTEEQIAVPGRMAIRASIREINRELSPRGGVVAIRTLDPAAVRVGGDLDSVGERARKSVGDWGVTLLAGGRRRTVLNCAAGWSVARGALDAAVKGVNLERRIPVVIEEKELPLPALLVMTRSATRIRELPRVRLLMAAAAVGGRLREMCLRECCLRRCGLMALDAFQLSVLTG